MKKNLLLSLAVLAVPMLASAGETVEFDFTNLPLNNMDQVPRQTIEPIDVWFTAGMNPGVPTYFNNAVRMNAFNNMNIQTSVGVIQQVKLTLAEDSWSEFEPDQGVMSDYDYTVTDINAKKVVLTNTGMQCRITKVEVTYANMPVISPKGGVYYEPQTVSISGEGDIYYTLDGTDPTAESTKYEAPFQVAESLTVKAVSISDGEASEIASAEYEIKDMPLVEDFAAALEQKGVVKFTDKLTAIHLEEDYYGAQIYVKAGNTYGLIYGEVPAGTVIENGTLLAEGLVVEFDEESNNPQFEIIGGFAIDGSGEEVNPLPASDMEQLTLYGPNAFVLLQGGFYNADMRSIKIGETDMDVYTLNYDIESPMGDGKYDIIGFINRNYWGEDLMIQALEFIDMATVAAPTSNIDMYTDYENEVEVVLTAEDGAEIYYTLDGTAPTTESTKYEGPFKVTMSCELKAVAVKDGETSNVYAVRIFIQRVSTIKSFAELADCEMNSNVILDFPMTCIWYDTDDYRSILVTDGTQPMYIKDQGASIFRSDLSYEPGDVIPAGVKCLLNSAWYNPEAMWLIADGGWKASTETAAVPEKKVVSDWTAVTDADIYEYMEIEGVEVEVINAIFGEFKATDSEGNEIAINDASSAARSMTNGKWNLTGFPAYDAVSGTLTFFVTAYSDERNKVITIDANQMFGGRIFNLQGVDCGSDRSHLVPGLYIINGKKVVVK